MAATNLPAGLRLAFDYTEELDRGLIRSEMAGGPGKQRPEFSRVVKTRQAKLVATSLLAKQAFDRWWDADLSGGCLWFNFSDPFTNQMLEARFVMPKMQWRAITRDLWESTVMIETLGI